MTEEKTVLDLSEAIRVMAALVENGLTQAHKDMATVLDRDSEIKVGITFKLERMVRGDMILNSKLKFVKERYEAKATEMLEDPAQPNLFRAIEGLRPKPGEGANEFTINGQGIRLHEDGRTERVGE